MRLKQRAAAFGVFFFISAAAYAETAAPDLTKKLDQILAAQKKIIEQLDEIKKELHVVKIRATQQ